MSYEVLVRVLYDYDYVSYEGAPVAVKRGETLRLLEVANDEWWRVCRGSSQFFVPANYVAKVDNQCLPQDNLPGRADSCVSRATSEKNSPVEQLPPKPTSRHAEPAECAGEVLYENLAVIQALIHAKPADGKCNGDGTNLNQWELHTDEETGRIYYYNTDTNEVSWEPPLLMAADVDYHNLPDQSHVTALSETAPSKTSTSIAPTRRAPPPPVRKYSKNWTASVDEKGEKILINSISGDRWYQAVDSEGRTYYYKENSQDSVWDLPEIDSPTQDVTLAALTVTLPESLDPSSEGTLRGLETPPNGSTGCNPTDVHSAGPVACDRSEAVTSLLHTYNVVAGEKRGLLNRCKLMEAGKKIKKNWNESYVVTTGMKLIFYQDEEAAISTIAAPHGKPEAIISLEQAAVQWTTQKTTKKNVLEVVCRGSLFLLQHDDVGIIQQWYIVLCEKTAPTSGMGSLKNTKNGDQAVDAEKAAEASTKQRFKGLRRLRGPSLTKNRKSSIEIGPVKDKLRSFISKRPAIESLQQKGIIQESVFNARLEHLCERESSSVPRFIEQCILAIEVKGLDLDGLYRISGNLAQIQGLRFYVNQNDTWDLLAYDVHVLTGALKLFFRELPEPVIPFNSYAPLVASICEKNPSNHREGNVKSLLAAMPAPNRLTLHCLFAHLLRVLQNSSSNRMQVHSLAIVFGPTLMWPEVQSTAVASRMVNQNKVVEYLLENFDRVM